MRTSTWGKVSPSDRAASAWPDATVLIPARIVSATNVPVYTDSTITAETKNEYRIPSFGKPKKNRNISSRSGVLRTTSTYTVDAHRRGGTGLTRNPAITVPSRSAKVND